MINLLCVVKIKSWTNNSWQFRCHIRCAGLRRYIALLPILLRCFFCSNKILLPPVDASPGWKTTKDKKTCCPCMTFFVWTHHYSILTSAASSRHYNSNQSYCRWALFCNVIFFSKNRRPKQRLINTQILICDYSTATACMSTLRDEILKQTKSILFGSLYRGHDKTFLVGF